MLALLGARTVWFRSELARLVTALLRASAAIAALRLCFDPGEPEACLGVIVCGFKQGPLLVLFLSYFLKTQEAVFNLILILTDTMIADAG